MSSGHAQSNYEESAAHGLVAPATCTPRFYKEGDEEQVLAVLIAAFDGWPKVETSVPPIEHLRWKIAGHAPAPPRHVVAEIDAKIVGAQFFFALPIKVGSQLLSGASGFDFAVHPEYRSIGVRTAMRTLSAPNQEREFDLQYGVDSAHAAMKRVDRKNQVDRRRLANGIESLVCQLEGRSATGEPPAIHDWSIRQVRAFDDRMDDFWAEASKPFEFIVARTRDYLSWRYADVRAGSFVIKLAEQDGHVLGYTVLRCSHGRGYVADLLALQGRTDVVNSLLSDAVRFFKEEGVSRAECWSPAYHPYRDALEQHGFVHRRRSIPLIARPVPPDPNGLPFRTNPNATIHVAIGDTDLA